MCVTVSEILKCTQLVSFGYTFRGTLLECENNLVKGEKLVIRGRQFARPNVKDISAVCMPGTLCISRLNFLARTV